MTSFRKSGNVEVGPIAAKPPFATPGQRIGLLGGSFNPPHAAHVLISKIAQRRLGLDAVWWIVTPGNPLKDHDALAPLGQRLAACHAIAPQPWIKITAFEAELQTAYTAATLTFLRARYRGVRFVWLMGADNLATFHLWQDWRGIANSLPMAVIDRPGHHLAAMASPAAKSLARSYVSELAARSLPNHKPPAWTLLTGQLSDLSSTALREADRR